LTPASPGTLATQIKWLATSSGEQMIGIWLKVSEQLQDTEETEDTIKFQHFLLEWLRLRFAGTSSHLLFWQNRVIQSNNQHVWMPCCSCHITDFTICNMLLFIAIFDE